MRGQDTRFEAQYVEFARRSVRQVADRVLAVTDPKQEDVVAESALEHIDAGVSVQHVITKASLQQVAPRTSSQQVIAVFATQNVVSGTTMHKIVAGAGSVGIGRRIAKVYVVARCGSVRRAGENR